MAETTGIQWADATWNPWMGCTKVSPGCRECYMFREQIAYGQDPKVVRRSKTTFTAPLRWKDRKRVFTCSWSDWFHEAADAWRDEAWDVVRRTPHHTYLILTKRPERIPACLPKLWGFKGWAHVWLGVSVETQPYAEARIPLLLAVPAAVRFLSCEPLLGPLDLYGWLNAAVGPMPRIGWVIAGGESGPSYRPMDIAWARELRDQCVAAGVPFFFKQYSGVQPKELGRVLDGREWSEWPAAW